MVRASFTALGTFNVALRTALQFPARSPTRTYTVWTPPVRAEKVVLVPVNEVGFAGGVAVPSIQYWPPLRPAPPVSAAPFAVSVTVSPTMAVVGDSVTLVKVGAVLSMRRTVVAVAPQLPTASLPRT